MGRPRRLHLVAFLGAANSDNAGRRDVYIDANRVVEVGMTYPLAAAARAPVSRDGAGRRGAGHGMVSLLQEAGRAGRRQRPGAEPVTAAS